MHTIHNGDVLDILPELPDNHFHAMLTDPPYGLAFMGKAWDHQVPGPDVWRETLRVLKPGAYALVFGGTRTWHRLAVALEDAGFEIRDTLMWVYGQGFPKSHNVSKAIDKAAGAEREVVGYSRGTQADPSTGRKDMPGKAVGVKQVSKDVPVTAAATPEAERWDGYGTALKPAWEPVMLARKPLDGTVAGTCVEHGAGALNIDECRIGSTVETWPASRSFTPGISGGYTSGAGKGPTQSAGEAPAGRWPANLIHDGSHEVTQHFPHSKDGVAVRRNGNSANGIFPVKIAAGSKDVGYGGSGSAARFFYTAKASKSERNAGLDKMQEREHRGIYGDGIQDNRPHTNDGYVYKAKTRNHHPTVKPLALNEYLARLLLPPVDDARILVPFSGSGSEMIGALQAGWAEAVGIERESEYVEIADARIEHWTQTDETTEEPAPQAAPLFAAD